MTNDQNPVATAQRQPVQVMAGGEMASIVPQSVSEVFELSTMLSYSGDMIPEAFRGNKEMIAAAIMRGMDIGLKPMQALSQIAVINGKACVWGDALPAMMLRAGHDLEEALEGEGDQLIATCVLTRGDNGKVVKREFSMDDAKRAGLAGKKGPWQTYPKRMLSMRARGWAIRDGAADALMGLQVSEEVSDYQPMRDVTPNQDAKPASGFAARRAALDAQAAEDATTHDDASAADDNNASKPPSQSTPKAKAEHGGESGRGDPESRASHHLPEPNDPKEG